MRILQGFLRSVLAGVAIAGAGAGFLAAAQADEIINAPDNVRATADSSRSWVSLSWSAAVGAVRYEVWGKVQLPQFLNYCVTGHYTGYSYYGAFNSRTARWQMIGTTTDTTYTLFYPAYASYMSYTEFAEYSPYGCYRIVAIGNQSPTNAADGVVTRGLPSAEVHPDLNGNDLPPTDGVTYEKDAANRQVTVRWSKVTGATLYEVYRKRQKHFVDTTSGGYPAVAWAANDQSAAFHPYFNYNSYDAFLANPHYTEFEFIAANDGFAVLLNVAEMAGLGGYHEYSAYDIYSVYLEYGIFKVVATNTTTGRRSPASAEAVALGVTNSPPEPTSTGGGVCFLGASARRR